MIGKIGGFVHRIARRRHPPFLTLPPDGGLFLTVDGDACRHRPYLEMVFGGGFELESAAGDLQHVTAIFADRAP